MRPAEARLTIDVGRAGVVAVVASPDGGWTPLTFEGGPVLSSAVVVAEDGSFLTGQAAWRAASVPPGRFIASPIASGDQVTVSDVQVDSVDVLATVLRRVAEEAARLVGGPVGEVRLVVPAGWGPRRRTWMRHAAHRAGLGQPTLVEAPVAVAEHLVAAGTQVVVGAFVVVCDLGAGAEVTVLRRGPTGFEVLATLADADVGGDAVDRDLVDALAGSSGDSGLGAAGDGRWVVLASVRAAKESLSWHPAVTVPLPSGAGVVVNGVMLEQVALPVVERAGRLTAEAIAAADLLPDDISGVYCVGGTSLLPMTAAVIGEAAKVTPVVVNDPVTAAVRGAAGVGMPAPPAEVADAVAVPSVRRAAAMVVPGFVSLGLVAQFLFTAEWNGALVYRWALLNWGELALAAVLAVVAALNAGTVLGALSAARTPSAEGSRSQGGQVGTGILAAVSLGVAVAGMYAIVGSLYLGLDVGPFLRWTLLPVAPMLVCALVAAVVAARGWRTPAGGWAEFLAFPNGSAVTAAAGMVLVQYSLTADRWPDMVLWIDLAGRVGGALLGVAVVMAVVGPLMLRLVLAAPVAVISAAIVSWRASGILGAVYAIAAAVWWLQRLWTRVVRATPPASMRAAG
ncbi:Hsp70 protein [Micromonospora pallida]|uniref:Hsp70 protein n=1 Tax=Micromonospora pallida TaxID=145854 RepID=A0A1C6RT31_9ACTN|nr:Hsp70 protein [Micromonospora pallida]